MSSGGSDSVPNCASAAGGVAPTHWVQLYANTKCGVNRQYNSPNCRKLTFGSVAAFASNDKASYYGGTVAAFKDVKKEIKGRPETSDDTNLKFVYQNNQTVLIPYTNFIDMEYGQKSGRRVGAAVATTVLLGPNGLLALMSKKQQHFLTLGFTDEAGKEQVAIFKLDKDAVRTILPILEARSGKKVEYQSKSAEKKATGK
jgi:hypothetical protein